MFLNPQLFLPWVPEVFLACGGNFWCWPKADKSSAVGRSHEGRSLFQAFRYWRAVRSKEGMKSRGGLGREVREPSLPSLTSPPPSLLFFRAPFTSHRSPLSERLEQATRGEVHYKDLTETGNRARKVSGIRGTTFSFRIQKFPRPHISAFKLNLPVHPYLDVFESANFSFIGPS